MIAAQYLPLLSAIIAAALRLASRSAEAVPVIAATERTSNLPVTSSGDVFTEVTHSGDVGSGTTRDLREGSWATDLFHLEGCYDNKGALRPVGSTWNIGCDEFCECVDTPEGAISYCSPPRCAIPMLSPGCQIVRNPLRNDITGENCCDQVECTPIFCMDTRGGKHELYTSWVDGELDCFCNYDYQRDTVDPICSFIYTPTTDLAQPNEIQYPENQGRKREELFNETNATFDVCQHRGNTYAVGESWKHGCEDECTCVQQGEITVAHCSPIPCPIPMMMPGCELQPNPNRDSANSAHCCDVVVCPPKQCIGENQILYGLDEVWYENGQPCTCVLNYNINEATKKCEPSLTTTKS